MKVVLIILMLLIPAWCFADGNKLLKQCGLAVAYIDGQKQNVDPSSSTEPISNRQDIAFCLGFMQGITNMNQFYQQVLKSDAQFCLPERE